MTFSAVTVDGDQSERDESGDVSLSKLREGSMRMQRECYSLQGVTINRSILRREVVSEPRDELSGTNKKSLRIAGRPPQNSEHQPRHVTRSLREASGIISERVRSFLENLQFV